MDEYKPLTPSFRQKINTAFDANIAELQTCEPNAFVNVQIEGLRLYKQLIAGLLDGFPMPVNRRAE